MKKRERVIISLDFSLVQLLGWLQRKKDNKEAKRNEWLRKKRKRNYDKKEKKNGKKKSKKDWLQ